MPLSCSLVARIVSVFNLLLLWKGLYFTESKQLECTQLYPMPSLRSVNISGLIEKA